MKRLVCIALLLSIKQANAQTVTIPDVNFAAYLQSIIPAAMSGNQLNTSSTLVTTTTHSINVANKSIANLSGVQYFTSLTYLNCDSNTLTSLPTLPNTLQTIFCINNYLDSLPVLPTSLQTIICRSNLLSKLATLPTLLTYLDCALNYITTLPALPNALTQLYCYNNSLTSLPALPASLQILYCDNNSLASLPALPNSLNTLYCNDNFLTSMPTLPNALQTLYCQSNSIACFSTFPNSITTLDIDPNPYYCLPNYIAAMSAYDLTIPPCSSSNPSNCGVAGIKQVTGNNAQITVYPNPASSSIQVSFSDIIEQASISMYDVNGKLVLSKSLTPTLSKGERVAVDISSLPEGVYNISLSTQQGVTNKRVVIVRD
jgi:type IX secretion system substrate protein